MLLRQIKYFVAVVDTGSFTEAAEQCFISQSAISQQILSMEKELGVQLLQRNTRQFTLTESGKYLYSHGKTLLGEIEKLKKGTVAAAADGQRRLGIAFLSGGCATERLYRAVGLFKQQNTDVRIEVTGGSHDKIAELLRSGSVDVVFSMQRYAFTDEYEHLLLASLPCCVEISTVFSAAQGGHADVEALRDIPCILVAEEKQQPAERAFYNKILGAGSSVLFARTAEEAHFMAAAGNGFVFTEDVGKRRAADGVKFLPLYRAGRQLKKDYYLFWRKDSANHCVKAFAAVLSEAYRHP